MEQCFDYIVVRCSGGHFMKVIGEVDLATAPLLTDALGQIQDGDIRLDLSKVTFLDAAGLRTSTPAHRSLLNNARSLTICGPISPLVQRTIEITGTNRVLVFDDTPHGARRTAVSRTRAA